MTISPALQSSDRGAKSSQVIPSESPIEIEYPDSDGQPLSDNTLQFAWITLIKENLEWLFAKTPEVFVAGDLLWYPVEGNPKMGKIRASLYGYG